MKFPKKYIWIPLIFIIGWLVWYFLKLSVYDIKVPEKPVVKGYMPEAVVWTSNGTGSCLLNSDLSQFDSVRWPKGFTATKDTGNRFNCRFPAGSLPLQTLVCYKNGYSYYKVLRLVPKPASDSFYNRETDYGLFLRKQNPQKWVQYPEVYKDVFEENKIELTLEKPNPKRVIALWENYALSGETDGKKIKIKVPRVAFQQGASLIRVWVCDSVNSSRICEIPLMNGLVSMQETWSPKVQNHTSDQVAQYFGLIRLYSGMGAADEQVQLALQQKISALLAKPDMAVIAAYGDHRAMSLADSASALLSNYFGKKLLLICNQKTTAATVHVPVKGDLKHSVNGIAFTQKGSEISITLPAGGWELVY